MSLQQDIRNMENELLPQIPAEVKQKMQQGTRELLDARIDRQALQEGDQAPDFALDTHQGDTVDTGTLRARGPVVVSFYRGGWCPYCNIELQGLEKAFAAIQQAGASLIALSPDQQQYDEAPALSFPTLVDKHNQVARKFGLVFNLPEILRPIYHQFGFDIPEANQDNTYELPIPSTYIINESGQIIFSFVNADYTQRCEPDTLIKVLQGQ